MLSLEKFKVYPQITQSEHFDHVTWKTVSTLTISCQYATQAHHGYFLWENSNVLIDYLISTS